MISADLREAQADALLATAEQYHDPLLGYAQRLAGSGEAGMELFQEAALRCHDTIQRHGFDEERGQYRFYLLVTIRNLHYEQRRQLRSRPLLATVEQPAEPPSYDPYRQLAEQIAEEVRQRYSPLERVWLRLHADGYSAQQIATLTGSYHRATVWERLDEMKAQLRLLFRRAFRALSE